MLPRNVSTKMPSTCASHTSKHFSFSLKLKAHKLISAATHFTFMEGKICTRSMSLPLNSARRRVGHRGRQPCVVSVLTRPADDATRQITKAGVYKDNWFDLLAINYLSKNVQAASGLHSRKSGYDSLVDAASAASQIFNPMQQRQVVIQALDRAFPRPILTLIKTLLPPSKFAREFFAAFTTLFFAWLVGPCEVRESESHGGIEKNVVHIKKCRFLEETNCVGMCINLCKMPSQSFIKDNLGIPVNMVPNYDDKSCEMVFGQEPPTVNDDPAFKQPCYKQCKMIKTHSINCPN